MPDGDQVSPQNAPMTRKQLVVGLASAGGFFGYLAIATVFHGNPTVHMVLVGPYGISAGIWFVATLLVGWKLAQREQRLMDRQQP